MKEIVGVSEPSSLGTKELVAVDNIGVEALVPRDQWDRPLILPATGHTETCKPRKNGGCTCMIGYTRTSTMSEALSDSYGLNRWQQSNVVKGLLARPDLLSAARVVSSKSELYEITDMAQEAGDNHVAARNGTTVHRLTERLDRGEDLPPGLPSNYMAMLEVYDKTMRRYGFQVHDTEGFVVQDKVQVAGSFDKHMGPYCGDLKTGQSLDYIVLKATMQVAMYAASDYYDIGTTERVDFDVDRNRGVLVWLPYVEEPQDAECELRWLDLRLGRKCVLEAIRVRELRKLKPAQIAPRIK